MNKVLYAIPVIVIAILIAILVSQYVENIKMRFKPAPFPYLELREFSLDKETSTIFTSNDFPKKPMIVNIFNSTCIACIREHPQLMTLAQKHGITIYGISYNDTKENIENFLTENGNPYERIAITSPNYDFKTLTITGTPTSFLLDANGMIRYRHKGIISQKAIDGVILPTMERIGR